MTTSHQPSSQQQAFHNYPQHYSKARQKATAFVGHLLDVQKRLPRSIVGTIVDTSYHLSAGYVTCTTQRGVVSVYGVPFGTVVAGMRVFCRQIGAMATNRAYIFDAMAPNLSGLGNSGSLQCVVNTNSAFFAPAITSPGGMPTTAALPTIAGYYWHCYFYLPTLPTTPVVLWEMIQSGGASSVELIYLPSGKLQFVSSNGHGYISTQTVAPHNTHWVQIQPMLSGSEMLIDGVANYTGLIGSSDVPTFLTGGASYTGYFLSDSSGLQICSIGSWISKIGFGTSYAGGIVPLPTDPPQSDSDISNLSNGTTQEATNLYLCTDAPGSNTLSNSGAVGSSATITTSIAAINALGPY